MSNVWVTNVGEEFFIDQWDSVQYAFSPNKPVDIPDYVARHIFAYKMSDKTPCLARLGWAVTNNDVPKAMERLNKFVITEEKPQSYHNASPVVERVPLPVSRRGGGKDVK
jgi:hypothetical protein